MSFSDRRRDSAERIRVDRKHAVQYVNIHIVSTPKPHLAVMFGY